MSVGNLRNQSAQEGDGTAADQADLSMTGIEEGCSGGRLRSG